MTETSEGVRPAERFEISDEDRDRILRDLGGFTLAMSSFERRIAANYPQGFLGKIRHPRQHRHARREEALLRVAGLDKVESLSRAAELAVKGQIDVHFYDSFLRTTNWPWLQTLARSLDPALESAAQTQEETATP